MTQIIKVPKEQYAHYEKYLLPQMRFMDNALADKGVESLMFKGCSMVLGGNDKFPHDQFKKVWDEFMGICVDMPPTEWQANHARAWIIQFIHYQHWTYNYNETYEQMVGDECYDGINA